MTKICLPELFIQCFLSTEEAGTKQDNGIMNFHHALEEAICPNPELKRPLTG